MKYVAILCSRSHPELNTIEYDTSFLEQYSHSDKYCISYTELEKVGINPQTDYYTPAGVSAYPLKLMYKHVMNHTLPLGQDRKYVNVLEITTKNIFHFGKYKNYMRDMYILHKYFNSHIASLVPDEWDEVVNVISHDGTRAKAETVYKITEYFAEVLKDGDFYIYAWNKMLHKVLKYDAILDPGYGIIHWNEPCQIIFLVPSAYKILHRLFNK